MLPEGFIFIQRDWLSSNSLLLTNGNQTALFDTGYATHAGMTLTVLESYLAGKNLDLILNTHLHSDHCGANALLQFTYPSVNIHIPATQFEIVKNWNSNGLNFECTGQICPAFQPITALNTNSTLYLNKLPWQIYGSPGHDHDSLIFYQPDFRILISGDALWENGLAVVFPELYNTNGFEEVSQTLDLIESLDPLLVIPGHGRMFSDIQSSLAQARRKLLHFSNDPKYHSKYSAKVLIKFKLMEIKNVTVIDFLSWCMESSLLIKIHEFYFKNQPISEWIDSLIQELEVKNFLRVEDGVISNL
jgi:glyoxylase-like metal-dependent hydrolase (beta-lactamase superfamily II)